MFHFFQTNIDQYRDSILFRSYAAQTLNNATSSSVMPRLSTIELTTISSAKSNTELFQSNETNKSIGPKNSFLR